MIRQKHAKRKSQTECEIHGQIHKVNYGEQSRDKEKHRAREGERAHERGQRDWERERESHNPLKILKIGKINNNENQQRNLSRSVTLRRKLKG